MAYFPRDNLWQLSGLGGEWTHLAEERFQELLKGYMSGNLGPRSLQDWRKASRAKSNDRSPSQFGHRSQPHARHFIELYWRKYLLKKL
jgi:hypothetical protein